MPKHGKTVGERIVAWYCQNARELPWRMSSDPYAIWISEVMLQQTQVSTVIPYYNNFLSHFPTVESLAKASEDELMKFWQGLGYYSRARNLQHAAKDIVESHGSQLPSTRDALIKLKGFGPYTSAAVASIAFGEEVPCVDGNVKRVVSRILASDEAPDTQLQEWIHALDPSDFNQGMMELGALICKPQNPNCTDCPLQNDCLAFKKNNIQDFPKKKVKTKVKNIFTNIFIPLTPKNHTYLGKRPAKGRWANLYEFPSYEYESMEARETNLQEFLLKHHLMLKKILELNSITHKLTHMNIHARIFHLQLYSEDTFLEQMFNRVKSSEIFQYPLSTFQKKAYAELKKPSKQLMLKN